MSEPGEIAQTLREVTGGSKSAVDKLFPLVYDELHRIAQGYIGRERKDHTLQPTALVHEAYLRLIDQSQVEWQDRAHFFALTARAMRRILVDHARRRGRKKREGKWQKLSLENALTVSLEEPPLALLALDLAMTKMEEADPVKARVVEMRFFGGLTLDETAEVLGATRRTVSRYWEYAKAWLYKEMTAEKQ